MATKEEMYKEVQLWKSSGKNKVDFILDKEYSKAKFEYWINKYNKEKAKPTKSSFKEIPKMPRDLAQLLVALGFHT
nr:hypothetical protein [uncultured Brumimicrobium sp.]